VESIRENLILDLRTPAASGSDAVGVLKRA